MNKKETKDKEIIRTTGKEIGVDGGKRISEMLKVNTTLRSLNLQSERKRKDKEKEGRRMDDRQ